MALQVTSFRRYCLLKRQLATQLEQTAIASLWQAKQEAEAGSDLPATFPLRARLAAAFYTTVEDLDGATVGELADEGCFTTREAEQVLAAAQELLQG